MVVGAAAEYEVKTWFWWIIFYEVQNWHYALSSIFFCSEA